MTCLTTAWRQVLVQLGRCLWIHHILLKPDDRPKTAIWTPFGHYQFKVLPFGLTNPPATFQTVMNKLLTPPHFGKDGKRHNGPVLSAFVLVFSDDTASGKVAKGHTQHLETVQIKPSNVFGAKWNCPTWFILGRDGIKPDFTKVKAVTTWPTPTTV